MHLAMVFPALLWFDHAPCYGFSIHFAGVFSKLLNVRVVVMLGELPI
jgi:hypothetical protein